MTNGIGRVGWRNFVSAAPTTASIITTGLVLNLDAGNAASYSGTGTVWTDLSGNGNNATLVNGTSYSSANGGTLTFDGINDYVDTDLLTNQSAFTYGVWAKSSANGFNNRIMGCGDSTGGSSGVDIIWGALGSNTIYSVRRGAGVLDIHAGYDTPLPITNFSGNWHYIVVTYDSVNGSKLYCDNVLVASKANIGFASSLKLRIGKDGNGYDAFNGSVGAVQVYNKALSSTEITQNFDATKSRFGFTSYTTRTAAFAIATGITDTTILNALNTFDAGLISNGLDTKMKALYPFVGGSATTHKYNFMDARDVDAAFRLIFYGGGVHSSTGYQPNGYNAYANTFLSPSALVQNNNAFGFYSRTEVNAEYYDMGAYTYGLGNVILARLNGNFYGLNCDGSYDPSPNSSSLGLMISSRTALNVKKGYRNNIEVQNSSTLSTGATSNYFYIGGIGIAYSARQIAFSFISSGLNATEVGILYTLTQAMQTSLSRAV